MATDDAAGAARRAVERLLGRSERATADCEAQRTRGAACTCQADYDRVLAAVDRLVAALAVYADGHNEASRALGDVARMGGGGGDGD